MILGGEKTPRSLGGEIPLSQGSVWNPGVVSYTCIKCFSVGRMKLLSKAWLLVTHVNINGQSTQRNQAEDEIWAD